MLTIGGTIMPSPSSMEIALVRTGYGERALSGEWVRDSGSEKRELRLEWAVLTGAELSQILTAAGDGFATVTYSDPATLDTRSMTAFASAREARMLRYDPPLWRDARLTLTEK